MDGFMRTNFLASKFLRKFASAAIVGLPLSACQTTTPLTWAVPPDAATQTVNGYPLAYSSRGTGPVVVFVGGVLTDYRIWRGALAKWEPDFQVVAVSPRHFYPEKWQGAGTDFTVLQHAKDLNAFIESKGGPVFLVGWSYGAYIAYEAARTRPDLVKRLVLVEAPLYSMVTHADAVTDAVRLDRANITAQRYQAGDIDGGLNYAVDAINGPGAWAATPEPFRQLVRDNAWTVVGTGRESFPAVSCSEFGSLKMPVLLVQGELTTQAFHEVVAEESRCLPQARVVTIPKAGHASPLLNPDAFKSAATRFFTE